MRNILIFITLLLSLISVFYLAPKDEVDGIKIPKSTYLENIVDAAKYRLLIKGTIQGELKDLEELINFWCGGGAGCYDHGAVIVQIMYKVGDRHFYTTAQKLSHKNMITLGGFIAAGFEYGGFVKKPENYDFTQDFPKTLALVKQVHNKD